MRFSLQVRYAICGVFDLAYNGHGEPVQVRVISERQGIPTRYLEQIFQRLRRAGLVEGKRGPGGGYTLSRPASELTLLAMAEAVEGPLAPFSGGSGELQQEAGEASPHRPDFLWDGLTEQLAEVLEGISIEDLCRQAARAALPRAAVEGYEYQI